MPRYRGAWLFAQFAMRRRAARSGVRAVHVTDPDALTPLGGRALLTTLYDLIPMREGVGNLGPIARRGYTVYVDNLRRADVIFAISAQTAADAVKLLNASPQRVVVARPGIETPPEPRASEADERDKRPYFLFVGGPNPNKNLGVLLDAMSMCPELPQELRIVGHWLPRQLASLESTLTARSLGSRVRHLGYVSEHHLHDLMRGATAFVMPSRHEGFGLPVGEALADGALVVHSRIPVLEETSRGAALTFDPDSASELASCLRIAAAADSRTEGMRRQGMLRARELTWDEAVAATLGRYQVVLGG